MKTILVDLIYAFVRADGSIFPDMYSLLETYPNPKILLTGADDEQWKKYRLEKMPYKVFTLKHNPEKTDPEYYRRLLKQFHLTSEDVVYFEHNADAVKSAQSVGVPTHYYDTEKQDLVALKKFLDESL